MESQIIREKIYEIRGQKVMLDFDLATLYGVETKALNQAVKRNIDRFPEDFMFRLTEDEWMRSQIVTASENPSQIASSAEEESDKAIRSQIVTSSQKKRKRGLN